MSRGAVIAFDLVAQAADMGVDRALVTLVLYQASHLRVFGNLAAAESNHPQALRTLMARPWSGRQREIRPGCRYSRPTAGHNTFLTQRHPAP